MGEQEALRELMQRNIGVNGEGKKTVIEEKSEGGRNFPSGHGTGR